MDCECEEFAMEIRVSSGPGRKPSWMMSLHCAYVAEHFGDRDVHGREREVILKLLNVLVRPVCPITCCLTYFQAGLSVINEH